MAEPTQIMNTISIGNLVTIISVVLGAIVNVILVTNKMTQFITKTEMRFDEGNKKFLVQEKSIEDIENKCEKCYIKGEVEELKTKREGMRAEQIKLRAELPAELANIKSAIGVVQKDVNIIKFGLIKKNVLTLEGINEDA